MPRLSVLFSQKGTTLLLGAGALGLVASIILFPDRAFHSSLQGLQLWWKLVFPALLPFLIITELLRGLGAIHGLGVLFEPLMRILFRVPGVGGFIMALSFTAGMPAGAAAVGSLRRDGHLSRREGERLLAFSHLLSPVILITVIGVGFLHSAAAGLALAVIHYGSALLLALFHRRNAEKDAELRKEGDAIAAFPSPSRLVAVVHDARTRDGRTFGKLLGDSVSSGVQQLFIIGGCMMMFSVLLQAITLTGIIQMLNAIAQSFMDNLGNSAPFLNAVLAGLFEPHLGAYALTAQMGPAASPLAYAVLNALLAWGGLSTHAQVRSFTANTDLRYAPFMMARLHHGGIAFLLTLLAWKPLVHYFTRDQSVSAWSASLISAGSWSVEQDRMWPFISPMMLQFGSALLVILVLSVFAAFLFHRGRKKPL